MITLYRKHRPQNFKDVRGQEHIVRTLKGAILSGKPGHAYMFTGPRGTGKTSVARLLAKALNCEKRKSDQPEPCNNCVSCTAITNGNSLDLIEIDAASNRGIDEIRNIKESAQVASSSSKYKIFIIDEVHMLTPPAFNALLKTLEEPPEHIVFILATTEAHKVLDTILSRVQRFDFKKISGEEIRNKLAKIAKLEALDIEADAISSIVNYAEGSLRDAESALSKIIAYTGNKITAQDAAEILGIVPDEVHAELLGHIAGGRAKDAITAISKLYESGVHIENFTKQFIAYARNALIEKIEQPRTGADASVPAQRYADIITAFVGAKMQLKNSPIPTLPLELAIIKLAKGKSAQDESQRNT